MNSWMFAAMIGATVMLLVYAGVSGSGALLDPARRRLQSLRKQGRDAVVARADPGLPPLWRALQPRDAAARDQLKARLTAAGLHPERAAGVYLACRLAAPVLVPLSLVLADALLPQLRLTPLALASLCVLGAGVGWLLPSLYLDRRAAARRAALMEGLPDALDLLVSCTEAGLSLNAALERVVEHMPASHPELAQELSRVNDEIRAGIDRTTALRNLAERTGLEEIRGLVSLVAHSVRLGTGIAGTLRIYAEEFRDRRMQRAEEIAATVGTRLIFPLVVCIFPSFFIVAIGPAILGVVRALSGVDLPGG